ncbi:metallophosphoesterase [Serratia ficaria]|uniref:metallophosphoesterase n=1 Tax=Serratia ficaria TaxID=61651 RepID=UPI002ED556D3|nr:metallophosphoesterase [Serratia ficaria]
MITELTTNTLGRDFVVGDLHGCLNELHQLLEHIRFDCQKDRLIAVGDLIDRGTHSLECLRLIEKPWFFSVLGNHEKLLIDYMCAGEGEQQDEMARKWCAVGGEWFFALDNSLRHQCYRNAVALPWAILIGTGHYHYCVIHAELPPEMNRLEDFLAGLQAADPLMQKSCLSGRRRYRAKYCVPIAGISYVLCGHTPGERNRELGNMYNLDYGAFTIAEHGALCLFELGINRRYLLRKDGLFEQNFGAVCR